MTSRRFRWGYLHSGRGSVAAEVAGVPGHVEDGDVDADARDVLREGAQEQEEGRQSPHRRQRATTDSHAALLSLGPNPM